ncbi:winged helix-turn-helix domain-containing protein [Candidatus Bathyarchaeota archaeon]|nr:winged helix-turn-helix domain-containing protein [Candidatus Bathyarchaeota archaeon]
MARTEGSGYKSQLYILLVLGRHGSLYGQEVADETGLRREEVWRNLKILIKRGIIKKEKIGSKAYYSPNVNQETLDYIISILASGGIRKLREQAIRYSIKLKRIYKTMIAHSPVLQEAKKHERELVELASQGVDPYAEALPRAVEWRETKRDMREAELEPSINMSYLKVNEMREKVKIPKELETKEVILSNGQHVVIRKLTLLEGLDIKRGFEEKPAEKHDLNFQEAVRKLSQIIS